MRAAWILVIVAACGDNPAPETTVGAVSGQRLALQWYGFPDGVRQPEPDEFYDRALHARCAPRTWADQTVRCVPLADQAAFGDDLCTEPVGRGVSIDEPTHFIGYDQVGDEVRPVRVYPAGDELDTIKRYYLRWGAECLGPYADPDEVTYYALGPELGGGDLVALHERELGEGRLALRLRESDDGMRVPLGLRDRTLAADCRPGVRDDGTVRCEPDADTEVSYFRDPACSQPVVAVHAEAPVPVLARMDGPSGCTDYYAVGEAVATTLYQRQGDTCMAQVLVPPPQAFAIGEPLELVTFARTLEPGDGRLQRVVLDDGELQIFDDVLFDRATRADCRRYRFEDGVTRCIPTALASSFQLYTPTCAVPVEVAELPPRSCQRPAFAATTTAGGLQLRAIGDRAGEPLHTWNFGPCRPYVADPGQTVHLLGPPIDPTAFAGALYYGER